MLGGVTLLALGLGSACSTDRRTDGRSAERSGATSAASDTGTPATNSDVTSAASGVVIRTVGSGTTVWQTRYREVAQRAVDPVENVWGRDLLPGRVTVNVPGSADEFVRITGVRRQVPAVTLPNRHVVIHPDLATRTSQAGREVVLRHELTHVALDQGSWASVPTWVVEGSAEYTAYRDQNLSPAQIAPGLAQRVRAGERFSAPPDDATVRGKDGYALAWSWCVYLVEQQGDSRFVTFVREVGEERSVEATHRAFRDAYDHSPEQVARGYSTWLASWL